MHCQDEAAHALMKLLCFYDMNILDTVVVQRDRTAHHCIAFQEIQLIGVENI